LAGAPKLPPFWKEWVSRALGPIPDPVTPRSPPPSPPGPKGRVSWNRIYNQVSSNDWIISDSVIGDCERDAEKHADPPAEFLRKLYLSSDYISHFGDVRGKRPRNGRGNNAKNWRRERRITGEFICPSLYKAQNIYQLLGQRVCSRKKAANSTQASKAPAYKETYVTEMQLY